jgi:hypothetical protein
MTDHRWFTIFSTMPLISIFFVILVKFARLVGVLPQGHWLTDIMVLLVVNALALRWMIQYLETAYSDRQ